jgi:hypothetical protein
MWSDIISTIVLGIFMIALIAMFFRNEWGKDDDNDW